MATLRNGIRFESEPTFCVEPEPAPREPNQAIKFNIERQVSTVLRHPGCDTSESDLESQADSGDHYHTDVSADELILDPFDMAAMALQVATEADAAGYEQGGITHPSATLKAKRNKRKRTRKERRVAAARQPTIGWPCAPGTIPELPCIPPTAVEMQAAHGVANNEIHELDHIAALRSLTFENTPAAHAPTTSPAQPTTDFRPTTPEDLYTTYTFHPRVHGKWVRLRLQDLNRGKTRNKRKHKWKVTGKEMWHEIISWFKANALDLKMAEEISNINQAKASALGKHKPIRWRPRCALWILPEQVLVLEARGIIWDLRPFLLGQSTTIEPLSYDNPDTGHWDRDLPKQWCLESDNPDAEFAQQLYDAGVHVVDRS